MEFGKTASAAITAIATHSAVAPPASQWQHQ
jgi:hypothetical protein